MAGSYDPVIVFDWLFEHGERRADGRYIKLRGKWLEDSHRDTFERWERFARDDPHWRVPLARFTDILFIYGVEWYEFESWAEDHYGTNGYTETEAPADDDPCAGA